MSATQAANQTDRVGVAVVMLPVVSSQGLPRGKMRILVGEDRDEAEILAWRFEFPSGLVSGAVSEDPMASGDVVLGSRKGYLEEVLVNKLTPDVASLVEERPSGMSPLAHQALRCISDAWQRLSGGEELARVLRHKELQTGPVDFSGMANLVDNGWQVDIDEVRVNWITE